MCNIVSDCDQNVSWDLRCKDAVPRHLAGSDKETFLKVQQMHVSVLVGLFLKKSYTIVEKLEAQFLLYSLILIRIIPKF